MRGFLYDLYLPVLVPCKEGTQWEFVCCSFLHCVNRHDQQRSHLQPVSITIARWYKDPQRISTLCSITCCLEYFFRIKLSSEGFFESWSWEVTVCISLRDSVVIGDLVETFVGVSSIVTDIKPLVSLHLALTKEILCREVILNGRCARYIE